MVRQPLLDAGKLGLMVIGMASDALPALVDEARAFHKLVASIALCAS